MLRVDQTPVAGFVTASVVASGGLACTTVLPGSRLLLAVGRLGEHQTPLPGRRRAVRRALEDAALIDGPDPQAILDSTGSAVAHDPLARVDCIAVLDNPVGQAPTLRWAGPRPAIVVAPAGLAVVARKTMTLETQWTVVLGAGDEAMSPLIEPADVSTIIHALDRRSAMNRRPVTTQHERTMIGARVAADSSGIDNRPAAPPVVAEVAYAGTVG